MRLVLIGLFLFSSLAISEEDGELNRPPSGEGTFAGYGLFGHDHFKNAPLTEAQQASYKKMISASSCAYVTPFRNRVTPRIKRVNDPCKVGQKRFICYSSIFCTNNIMPITVSDAICWSKSATQCPTAQECALNSFLGSADNFGGGWESPVLKPQTTETTK